MKNKIGIKSTKGIEALAKAAGKKPFDLVYEALGHVLAKAPVGDLQRVGIVSGDPDDGKTDRNASAALLAEIFGDSLRNQIKESDERILNEVIAATGRSFERILHERLYLGLGVDFEFEGYGTRADLRKTAIQLKHIQRRYARIAAKGDDPEHPYCWHCKFPQALAKMFADKIGRDATAIMSRLPKITGEQMKAYEARLRKEVSAMKKRIKGRACAFEWLTPSLYFNLCRGVVEGRKSIIDKLKIKPLLLVTRKDIVYLLSQRYFEIREVEDEMNGPHDKMFTKSYYRWKIGEIKKQIKEFPKDMQKEAKEIASQVV